MKGFFKRTIQLVLIGSLSACTALQTAYAPVTPTQSIPDAPGLSDAEAKTLASLKQVNDYPLYTMQYYAAYAPPRTSRLPANEETAPTSSWACSLFTVLLDEEHLLYGRNFDWEFSPALLLFTDPPDGYASVSMVNIAYLGFDKKSVSHLTSLSPAELEGLLEAPSIPFDGMNEHGLAIGMAAVTEGNMQTDPSRETIGSLGIVREILDHARNVNEAIALLEKYNIDFTGGPALHYLIADAKGKAVLVEFHNGEMVIMNNEQPWHSTTNFLRSSVENAKDGNCWRYDRINDRLNEKQGLLDSNAAMQLLSDVSQESTQWSVVYQMARGEVSVTMGRDYENVQTFQTSDYFNLR